LAFLVLGYVALVVALEIFVGVMGSRQAARGLAPDDDYVALVTRDDANAAHSTVVAGVEIDGRLYVAANHWPRAWHRRALAHPEIELTRGGGTSPVRAVPVSGEELARVERAYALPLFLRVLTGFPPREFLRLDPR
jgi:hypothetical protein